MGAVYMWLVEVYYYNDNQWDHNRGHLGVWHRYYKYDKVFKNKADAMQYVVACRRVDGIDAKLVKWYGD